MTKWQLIKFADVKVGDTIKSVSPCGTVRRGVVTERYETWASDVSGAALIEDDYALYRRAPKFTPQDVPTVGQWGEFTMRSGRNVAGEVTEVRPSITGNYVTISVAGQGLHINLNQAVEDSAPSGNDIIAWTPTTPPAPEEPKGKYAVALDNALFAWTRNTYGTWVPVDSVTGTSPCKWAEFVKRFGPVAVLSQGVTR